MYGLDDSMFGDFKKVENYKLKNGEHKFRILPPFAEGQLYAFVRLHWMSNQDGSFKIPVRCLATKKAGAEEVCPICWQAKQMKDKAANLKATGDVENGQALEDRASNINARATYIWQILDNEGQHKVLSIGYRAHEALKQKVGFYWKQKKVNVTNPERNYKIYCNRTGQKAQTNYAFEVLDGPQDVRKIDVPELHNLNEIHETRSIEEMKKIAVDGFVTIKKKDDTELPTGNTESKPQETKAETPSQTETKQAEDKELEQSAAKVEAPPVEDSAPAETNPSFGGFTADDIPF